ncbi:MAG: hypothetical protein PHH11_04010 [Methylomonas sp.]|nr:hypothetical protein [Methylomonas sp.]
MLNNGASATTRTDWDINLVLSESSDPESDSPYFLFYENVGFILDPGEVVYRDASNAASFNLFLTQEGSLIPNGTYYMSLWVDDLKREPESNEINNISTGNQQATLSGFSAKRNVKQDGSAKMQSTQVTSPTTSVFNGKHLPSNIMMRKVEISERGDGSKSIAFTDEVVTVPKTTTQGEQVYGKVMKSADYAVFQRTTQNKMPVINDTRHDNK